MHCIYGYQVARDGRAWLVGSTHGGDQRTQRTVQTITNLIDFGMTPQAAIEAPRWYSFPGTDPEHVDKPFVLRMEQRFSPEAVAQLQARGHRVERLGPWAAGGAVQVIQREGGTLLAGSD